MRISDWSSDVCSSDLWNHAGYQWRRTHALKRPAAIIAAGQVRRIETMSPRKNILIVGGGVAGLDLAGQLAGAPAKRLGLDLRLIAREPAPVWTPMLPTIAAGPAAHGPNPTHPTLQAQPRGPKTRG